MTGLLQLLAPSWYAHMLEMINSQSVDVQLTCCSDSLQAIASIWTIYTTSDA